MIPIESFTEVSSQIGYLALCAISRTTAGSGSLSNNLLTWLHCCACVRTPRLSRCQTLESPLQLQDKTKFAIQRQESCDTFVGAPTYANVRTYSSYLDVRCLSVTGHRSFDRCS